MKLLIKLHQSVIDVYNNNLENEISYLKEKKQQLQAEEKIRWVFDDNLEIIFRKQVVGTH